MTLGFTFVVDFGFTFGAFDWISYSWKSMFNHSAHLKTKESLIWTKSM